MTDRRTRTASVSLLLAALLAAAPALLMAAEASSGPYPFIWPVTGTITRGVSSTHDGVDIAASTGVNIGAARGGIVEHKVTGCTVGDSTCGGGYGNHIIIKHGGCNHRTLYAHMSTVASVSVGSSVSKNQFIGEVGNTGRSSGSHLHFEIVRGTSGSPYDGTPQTIPTGDSSVVRNTDIRRHYDPCG